MDKPLRKRDGGLPPSLDLLVVKLPMGTSLTLPLEVVCGVRAGLRVWLTSMIHGKDLNGLEIARQAPKKIDSKQFAGTLIAVPVMNVLGFVTQQRTLPDGSDPNRNFLGLEDGRLAERLASYFLFAKLSRDVQ